MENLPQATQETIDKVQNSEGFKTLVYRNLIKLFSDNADTKDAVVKCAEATAYVSMLKKEVKHNKTQDPREF